jgi:hypothetical protein
MTFLPILERELRARSRNRATYWSRFVVALLGVLVCLPQLLGGGLGTPASLGRYVFNGILTTAFLLSCCACFLTANAIDAERQDGTLGLLFLTRVRALDVLLGKLGSLGVSMLCALVAFLPVLVLPLLAGGVTVGEAFRKWLAVIATLFLAVAVGLHASSFETTRSKASFRAALTMLLLVLIPAWFSQIYTSGARTAGIPWLGLPSPLMTVLYGGDVAYRAAPRSYWLSVATVGLFAVLWLLLARTCLVRSLREMPATSGPASLPSAPAEQTLPVIPSWRALSQIPDPVEWLVCRQRGLLPAIWTSALLSAIFQGGMIPLYSYAWRITGFRTPWFFFSQMPLLAISIITGSLLAWAASRFFVEARRKGELELLVTTPAGAASMVSGQWRALTRMLRWPVAVMVAPLLLRMWLVLQGPAPYDITLYEVWALLLGTATTLLGVAALCWLGMWFGLRARSQAGAIAWSIGLVRGVPHLISIGWSILVLNAIAIFSGASPRPYRFLSWVPTVVILLAYVWLIVWAKRSMAAELTGAEWKRLTLGQFCSTLAKDLAGTIRKVRHWTPS